MASLRRSRLTLFVLAVAAMQALLPLAVYAKMAHDSRLSQEICTPQGLRLVSAAAADGSGQAQQPAPAHDAKDRDGHCPLCASASLLPVQALINLHIHETPAGINRLATACVASSGAAPAPLATGPPGHG
jgi:hypothetical protein